MDNKSQSYKCGSLNIGQVGMNMENTWKHENIVIVTNNHVA